MEQFLDETEWWDRVALAVDLLVQRTGAASRRLRVAGRDVEWRGDGLAPEGAVASGAPSASAYMFPQVRDVEILRRLTQMPDETPLDLLARPFTAYCRELGSFVSVNDPDVRLEEHLKRLEGGAG